MSQAAEGVPEITPTELKKRLDGGDRIVLVDVREHFERRIADLPENGQIRIPTGEFLARLSELDPGADLVVYCRSGARSAWATQVLMDRGYPLVSNLKGGVLAWRDDVDPSLTTY